jgi:hypothetical protein
VYTRGMVVRSALKRACAGEMYGTQSEKLHAEKAEEARVQKRSPYKGRPRTSGTQRVQDMCPTQRDRSDWVVESGRPPTGGPVHSDRERTHVLPESLDP